MSLSVPEKHQLKIAHKTMTMHCVGCRIMGGPNHKEAAAIIERLTGRPVMLPTDCNCPTN